MKAQFFKKFYHSSFSIFVLAFFWALVGGLLLQFVVLPALPSVWHVGDGLLQGGDWVGFHRKAVMIALQITQDGWGVWELRPGGNAPTGILAGLYFVFGIYKPWLFLPINAFLFGAATFTLYKIFKLIMITRHSFYAILPFMMFPSALMIYGQVHKDIFSITGILFVIFVWANVAGRRMLNCREMLVQAVIMFSGLALVWLVRPYIVQLLLLGGLSAALLLSVWGIWGKQARHGSWWCMLAIFLTIQLGALLLSLAQEIEPTTQSGQTTKQPQQSQVIQQAQVDKVIKEGEQASKAQQEELASSARRASVLEEARRASLLEEARRASLLEELLSPLNAAERELMTTSLIPYGRGWSLAINDQMLERAFNNYLPGVINDGSIAQSSAWFALNVGLRGKLAQLNEKRRGFATSYPRAATNIDLDVRFYSIHDLLLYIPRALQIGLLAPFPSMWLGNATSPGSGTMRLVAGMEMMLSYLLLLGLVGLCRCEKKRWATIMVVMTISLILTIMFTLVITNVGSLYRMRYVSWQILNGLGILGWSLWLQRTSLLHFTLKWPAKVRQG